MAVRAKPGTAAALSAVVGAVDLMRDELRRLTASVKAHARHPG